MSSIALQVAALAAAQPEARRTYDRADAALADLSRRTRSMTRTAVPRIAQHVDAHCAAVDGALGETLAAHRTAVARNDAAPTDADAGFEAVAIAETLPIANAVATHEVLGTLRGIRARYTEPAVAPAAGRDRESTVDQLGAIGAGAEGARLIRETVAIGAALVATAIVDAADLTAGTIRVRLAEPLRRQLTDVERFVALHTPRAAGAVARRLALHVTAAKRADEG